MRSVVDIVRSVAPRAYPNYVDALADAETSLNSLELTLRCALLIFWRKYYMRPEPGSFSLKT
jgi:hypothetical protein